MDYDVTVIGGGPGGYVAAIKAAQQGKRTCIVEKVHYGGTCLNEGCIPTKALVKTASLYEDVRRAAEFGVIGADAAALRVDAKAMRDRKRNVVKQLVNGVQGLLRGNKVAMVQGEASFVDAHTIQVGDKQITSEYFIIATGSETVMPSFIEYEGDTNIITSTEALELEELPESMIIIGGGVIGMEFAYIFSAVGVKVTVVELMKEILPMVDGEIAAMVRKKLTKAGVEFRLGARVKKVSGNTVVYELDDAAQSAEAQTVLMAVGRAPYIGSLNIEAVGIEMDRKAIKTDAALKTNIDTIYAIGDVNGKAMLAHTASHEGLVAVANICGYHEEISYDAIPSCIYVEPEIASVGLTEEQAKEKYGAVRVGKFPMVANGKSLVEGNTEGMIKVILDDEFGEILGVHIWALHSPDMIAEIALAMNCELTADELLETIHPHPSISEALPEAFMAAVHKAIHCM